MYELLTDRVCEKPTGLRVMKAFFASTKVSKLILICVKPACYNLSIFFGRREPLVVIPIDFIESNDFISEIIS
jgi:hypothetical protein